MDHVLHKRATGTWEALGCIIHRNCDMSTSDQTTKVVDITKTVVVTVVPGDSTTLTLPYSSTESMLTFLN
jgi:hypothetical protein